MGNTRKVILVLLLLFVGYAVWYIQYNDVSFSPIVEEEEEEITREIQETKKMVNDAETLRFYIETTTELADNRRSSHCYDQTNQVVNGKSSKEKIDVTYWRAFVESIDGGERKALDTLWEQKEKDTCIEVLDWEDDKTLRAREKKQGYIRTFLFHVEERVQKDLLAWRKEGNKVTYQVKKFNFSQTCEEEVCGSITVQNIQRTEKSDRHFLEQKELITSNKFDIYRGKEFFQLYEEDKVKLHFDRGYAIFDFVEGDFIETKVFGTEMQWEKSKFDEETLHSFSAPVQAYKKEGAHLLIADEHKSIRFFRSPDEERALFTISVVPDADMETVIDNVFSSEQYLVKTMQEKSIGTHWGKLFILDTGDQWAFIPLPYEIIVLHKQDMADEDWKHVLRTFEPAYFPARVYIPELYEAQKNIRKIRVFDIDFNGDGVEESVLYFVSEDLLFNGAIRINEHLRIFAADGTVLKEDVAVQQTIKGGNDKNNFVNLFTFHTLEVMDFADGKQALFVQKRGVSPYPEESKYYIFGLSNGKFQNFSLQRGYHFPEKYIGCIEAIESIKSDEHHDVELTVIDGKVIESFYYDNICLADDESQWRKLQVVHEYVDGEFVSRLNNNQSVTSGWKQDTSNDWRTEWRYEDIYLFYKEEAVFDGSLKEHIPYRGETVTISTYGYETEAYQQYYIRGGVGCGGCTWFEPYYFRRDKVTDELQVFTLDETRNPHFFSRGVPQDLILSPDKTKLAFVFAPINKPEQLFVYDFVTQEETLLYTFEGGKTVRGFMGGLFDSAISWSQESKTIFLTPYRD